MLTWIQISSIFFLLFILLLVAPFNLSLELNKRGPPVRGIYRIGWLGLTLMKGDILSHSPQGTREMEARVEEKEAIVPKKRKNLMSSPSGQSLLDAFPALFRLLKDLLKSIELKKISCRLCFGLDDPAQTAVMSGYLWSVASALRLFPGHIFIEPRFDGEQLEGDFTAELRARMLWIAMAMIGSLRERKIRRLLMEMAGRA
ncbi:Uncharacterised protein [uncultured archaeon]|nr:Uncharacterised protein [uncultured archaeon]